MSPVVDPVLALWQERQTLAQKLLLAERRRNAEETPDTERAVEQALHQLWAADERIASTPATTPQGLRAKLLCAVANLRECDGFNEDGTPSLIAEQDNAIPLFLAACADAERLI
jgi:hypothetical protein